MYFEAVFQPLNDTDYNSEVADFTGKKVAIQEGWILEEGPCKGQKCFDDPHIIDQKLWRRKKTIAK